MIRIQTICLIALLMFNLAAFTQTAKPTPVPQKIDGYIFKNSDTVLLTESNVCNLDLRLLTLARNEIYARHGYIFKDKSLQDYFNNRKWYKIDAKYTGKLYDVELKNVELIKKYEESKRKFESTGCNNRIINNISNFDLDGDGKIENIKYYCSSPYKNHFTLIINGITIKKKGVEINEYFDIVDINENDIIKEIVVKEWGTGDDGIDSITHFYYFDGHKIINMGDVNGLCGTYKSLNGKGTVYVDNRFHMLQMWYFIEKYKLTSMHQLKYIKQPYYLISHSDWNKSKIVLKSFHLYSSPNSKKVVVKLRVGEKIHFIGSDKKEWCLVKTIKGKTGWFAIDKNDKVRELGISAAVVLSGLETMDLP